MLIIFKAAIGFVIIIGSFVYMFRHNDKSLLDMLMERQNRVHPLDEESNAQGRKNENVLDYDASDDNNKDKEQLFIGIGMLFALIIMVDETYVLLNPKERGRKYGVY